MSFIQDVIDMPYHIIERADFQNRTLILTFKTGTRILATCPEGNNQCETLKKAMLDKLGKDKVRIYDN